jgi:hypothetical protein
LSATGTWFAYVLDHKPLSPFQQKTPDRKDQAFRHTRHTLAVYVTDTRQRMAMCIIPLTFLSKAGLEQKY